MYFTIRPAGPRTKKEQMRYYLLCGGYLLRRIVSLVVAFLAMVSWLTGNYGALALLAFFVLIGGLGFNLFKVKNWLPGWKTGSWFTRTVSIAIYVFTILTILLVYDPPK